MNYYLGPLAFVAAALGIVAADAGDGVLGADPVQRVEPFVRVQDAQQACRPREVWLSALLEGYGEAPRVMALDGNGRVVEWTVAASGSWSMLVTAPGGQTCLIAGGVAFGKAVATAPGEGA